MFVLTTTFYTFYSSKYKLHAGARLTLKEAGLISIDAWLISIEAGLISIDDGLISMEAGLISIETSGEHYEFFKFNDCNFYLKYLI
jgi:hypothetical protein